MIKKIFKVFVLAAIITAAFSLVACDLGGKDELEQLKADKAELQRNYDALAGSYAELSEEYKNVSGQLAGLQESSKMFFNIAADSQSTVSAPLFFNGIAGWNSAYDDITSPAAAYKALPYSDMKMPDFKAGQLIFYRFTCVFMQTGTFKISFAFNNLKALDMTASIKATFRLYAPLADGYGVQTEDYSLFLYSSVGEEVTIGSPYVITTSRVNIGYTHYIGFYISNNGAAPTYTGKAFSMDSLAIKVVKVG